jgi:hypothetical protein
MAKLGDLLKTGSGGKDAAADWANKTFAANLAKCFVLNYGVPLKDAEVADVKEAKGLIGARYLAMSKGFARATPSLAGRAGDVFGVPKAVRETAKATGDYALCVAAVEASMRAQGYLAGSAPKADPRMAKR